MLVTIAITLQFYSSNLSITKTSFGDQFIFIKSMLWPADKVTGANTEQDFVCS